MTNKANGKILGMLWGLHAGEALGAPWEFLPPAPTWNHHTEIIGGGKFQWKAGEATDDTDLMLCLLRSIQDSQTLSFDKLKNEMLAWMASSPPDIGMTTLRGLKNLAAGLPLLECGHVDFEFQGNGSLMRVAPLSLLEEHSRGIYQQQTFDSLNQIIEIQTKMTHGHDYCVQCDRIFVRALKGALKGQSKEEIFQVALSEARQISNLIYERLVAVPKIPWEELATSGFCVDTLCAGFWALLTHDTFAEAIIAVINRGDDSDSCGAVAGALCGAFYGATAIPERWLNILEFRNEIESLLKERAFIGS